MQKRAGLILGLIVLIVVLVLISVGWFSGFWSQISGSVISSDISCEEGIIAYYGFEDEANDLITNKEAQIYDAIFSEGKFGKGVEFDGDDDYIKIPRSEAVELQEISFSIWIYLEPGVEEDDLFAVVFDKPSSKILYENPYYDYHLRFDQANGRSPRLFASFVTGAAHSSSDDITLSKQRNLQGKWSHIVTAFDGEIMKVYVNGERKVFKSNQGSIIYHDTDLYLGRYKNLETGDFRGKMDEFVIYNKVLNDVEVERLYNEGEGQLVCKGTESAEQEIAVETPKIVEEESEGTEDISVEEVEGSSGFQKFLDWLRSLFS